MVIQGNLLGLEMFVVGGVVAGVGFLLLKLPDPVTMSAVGVTLIVMDGVIRFRSRQEARWIISKQFGGYLFFIPVWGFGVIVIIANLISGLKLA